MPDPERTAPKGLRDIVGGGELEAAAELGDAGELLDGAAKAACKARLNELKEELEEAKGFHDPGWVAKARAERDLQARELARAVGLGGRDRRAASHAERARLNATRVIRVAITNLARANPHWAGIAPPPSGPAGTAPTPRILSAVSKLVDAAPLAGADAADEIRRQANQTGGDSRDS
jgi:hypothetical protein